MGGHCLEHERRSTRDFVRGRPFAVGSSTTVGSTRIESSALPENGNPPTLDLHTSSDFGLELSRVTPQIST